MGNPSDSIPDLKKQILGRFQSQPSRTELHAVVSPRMNDRRLSSVPRPDIGRIPVFFSLIRGFSESGLGNGDGTFQAAILPVNAVVNGRLNSDSSDFPQSLKRLSLSEARVRNQRGLGAGPWGKFP